MCYTFSLHCFRKMYSVAIDTPLMIKNIPSSFEYRRRRDARRIRDETFSMPDYGVGHGRVNSSPEEKRLPPRSSRVSDILPGIVAQVKREVGSPFLYYSRWITRPLSHSLQFKCNEPHRYIPSYSFSGSLFSPPFLPTYPNSSTATPLQRDVIPAQSRHFSPLLERP